MAMEKLHEALEAAALQSSCRLAIRRTEERKVLSENFAEKMEILEHEFNAALNVERVNFPTMDGASRSGVQARAAYAASLEEQRLDTLGAIARALRRARLAQEAAERG